ncbi:helix-turn-helix transcriptional regulator [Nostocoides sp.]|uniref:helix-turn-helix transcriptional regulator n=1 Tax=Nostocoides sp. TaxID=1917966 RepID=UPI002BC6BB52|nr:winged helix-turn-helix domain-containing protein [Tetrasphaera sp.]
MSTHSWTFLTNHTHVLVCIARDPAVTMREVAEFVGITERAVQRIVRDLVDGGYLTREREGRQNRYRLRTDHSLRHDLERSTDLAALLRVLLAGIDPCDPKTSRHTRPG